jgi:hypothetical protein
VTDDIPLGAVIGGVFGGVIVFGAGNITHAYSPFHHEYCMNTIFVNK